MRNTMLAIVALLFGTVVLAGPTPAAAAYDYPWCAMGGELGGPAIVPIEPVSNARHRSAPQRRSRAAQYDHNNEPYFGASQGYAPGEKQRFLDDVRRRD